MIFFINLQTLEGIEFLEAGGQIQARGASQSSEKVCFTPRPRGMGGRYIYFK